jgi:hypothetical protein
MSMRRLHDGEAVLLQLGHEERLLIKMALILGKQIRNLIPEVLVTRTSVDLRTKLENELLRLLTWTIYGHGCRGDGRGFVGPVSRDSWGVDAGKYAGDDV